MALLSHLDRINLFVVDVPEVFLRDIQRVLAELYPITYDETSELPREYQRYLRPHLLRTKVEIAILTLAKRHGLASDTRKNRSQDAHALVLTDRFAMTLSRTSGPDDPPRWAKFRVDYSRLAQYWLPGPEFAQEQPPVVVRENDPRLFVVISHGPDIQNWRELGFVHANFCSANGTSYSGKGIDLIARIAADLPEHPVEEVREPEFRPQVDDETAERGSQ